MANVDERVVELRFDKDQFEEGVGKAISALDKLNQKLDFDKTSAKSLENLDKIGAGVAGINFDSLSSSIDTVNNRFSLMGVVGMSAINNITTGIMGIGKKLLTAIPGQIKNGGITRSLKLEQAKFQIEGLGFAWDQTSKGVTKDTKLMKDAVLDAIEPTAYGLDEAANVAGQLAASGVTVEEMTKRLRGVAGVAAMSGDSFENVGRIFTTVAGQGRVMGDQLLQLSSRGLNGAQVMAEYANSTEGAKEHIIEFAKATGKYNSKVQAFAASTRTTEADIRELVSAGVIDFETFANAMENAFGDHAAAANDTFKGSLMNLKAAFSRLGSEVATTQLVNLRYIFNELRPIIYHVVYALEPFYELLNKITTIISQKVVGALHKLRERLGEFNKEWSDEKQDYVGVGWTQKIRDRYKEEANYTQNAANLWKKYYKGVTKNDEDYKKKQKKSDEKATKERIAQNKKASKNLQVTAKEYQAALDIWYKGAYGEGDKRKKALQSVGLSYKNVQGAVNELVRVGYNEKKANIDIIDSAKKREKSVKDVGDKTKETTEIVEEERKQLSPLAAIIKTVANTLRFFKNIISGLLNLLKIGFGFIKAIVAPLFKLGLNGVASFSDGMVSLSERFNNFTKGLLKKSAPAMVSVSKVFGKFGDAIWNASGKVKAFFTQNELLSKIKGKLMSFFKGFKNHLKGVAGYVKDIFKGVKGGDIIATVTDKLKTLWNVIKPFFSGKISTAASQVKQFVSSLRETTGPLDKVSKLLNGSVFKGLSKKGLGASLGGGLNNMFAEIDGGPTGGTTGGKESLKSAFEKLKEMAEEIKKSKIAETITKFFDTLLNGTKWDVDSILARAWEVTKIVATLKAVKQLSKLTGDISSSTTKLINSFTKVADSVSTLMGSLTKLADSARKSIKLQAFKTIALSIALLAASLWLLSKIETDKLAQSMGAFAAIFAMLIFTLKTVTSEKFDTVKMVAAAKALSSMGLSMLLISIAAKIFASMSPTALAKAGVSLIAFIVAFGAATRLANKVAGASLYGFLSIAIGLNLLVPAIIAMSKMKFETLARGGAAIMAFILMIGLASRAIAKNRTGLLAFLSLSAAITALVPAIVVLAMMPFDKALKAAIVLGLIMRTMAKSVSIAGAGGFSLATTIGLTVMITALSTSLIALAFIPFDKLLKSVASLTATILAMKAVSKIAGTTKWTGLFKLAIVMGLLTSVLVSASYLKGNYEPKFFLSLGVMFAGMAVMIGILSKIPFTVGIKALELFASWFLALTAILYSVGGVANWIDSVGGNIRGAMETAVEICGYIGAAIGTFFGSIASSFIDAAIINTAEIWAASLSAFMVALQPFIDGAKKISPRVATGIKNLAAGILALTTANIMNGKVISFITGSKSLTQFAASLIPFMFTFRTFAQMAAKLTDAEVNGANNVATAIKHLGKAAEKIPTTGGLKGAILGAHDLADFGAQLFVFIPMFSAFAASAKNVTGFKKIKAVSNAIADLGKAAEKVPETGFLRDKIIGVHDLADFGDQLSDFIGPFKDFSESAVDVNADGVKKVGVVADAVAEMAVAADKIPKTEGLKQKLGGVSDLGDFGNDLADFAPMFVSFSKDAATITPEQGERIKVVAGVVVQLATAAQKISEITGGKGKITKFPTSGDMNVLTDFAKSLTFFAPEFKKFADEAGKLDEGAVDAAVKIGKCIKALSEAAVSAKDAGGSNNISENLKSLAQGAKNFIDNLSGADASNIETVGESLSKAVKNMAKNLTGKDKDFKKAGKNSIAAYNKAIKSGGKTAKKNASGVGKSAAEGIKTTGNKAFKSTGIKNVNSYVKAFSGKKKDAKAAGKSVANNAKSGAEGVKFGTAGSNAATGFAQGIKDNWRTVAGAGTYIGEKALEAAKRALKEKSPSRAFMEVGEYVDLGFAQGMYKYSDKVYNSAYETGEEAIDGALASIKGFNDDINPTITPVVDLSNVRAGARQISSIMGSANPNINTGMVNGSARQQEQILANMLAGEFDKLSSELKASGGKEVYNFGDISLDARSLEDVMTVGDFVSMLKRAKAFS